MFIALYFIVIFICFFVLYVLSRHDFVLLRQNISLAQIFDALFITIVSAFLLGRAFYMIDRLASDLLSFFAFFHIFKYPGISILGAYLGSVSALYLIFMKKKGLVRIIDIFSISFFPLFLINLLLDNYHSLFFLIPVFFIISILFFVFFIISHNKYILRDGSISIIFLVTLSAQTFFSEYIASSSNKIIFFLSLLQILTMILIPINFALFYINQRKKNS